MFQQNISKAEKYFYRKNVVRECLSHSKQEAWHAFGLQIKNMQLSTETTKSLSIIKISSWQCALSKIEID